MEATKTDLVLSDGREINIDMYKITIKEYRGLFDKEQTENDGDAILGKVCGLTVDEIQSLPQPDYRLLASKFFAKAKEPLANPN